MSFVEPGTLQVIADSIGIPKLSADAAKVLAPDVEYRIREVIQVTIRMTA
jgi:transcription initiation factor TFIID subunit 6